MSVNRVGGGGATNAASADLGGDQVQPSIYRHQPHRDSKDNLKRTLTRFNTNNLLAQNPANGIQNRVTHNKLIVQVGNSRGSSDINAASKALSPDIVALSSMDRQRQR